jgi:hypothetical protein
LALPASGTVEVSPMSSLFLISGTAAIATSFYGSL